MEPVDNLPDGFRKVSVILTEGEYRNLRHGAALTGEGTFSAAIRKRLGWHETPYGLKAATRRQRSS